MVINLPSIHFVQLLLTALKLFMLMLNYTPIVGTKRTGVHLLFIQFVIGFQSAVEGSGKIMKANFLSHSGCLIP